MDPEWFTPDPGQGALALETRRGDTRLLGLTAPLMTEAGITIALERHFLRSMGGGCQTPLGALATLDAGGVTLRAMVASPDGRTVLRETLHGGGKLHLEMAAEVAAALRAAGADMLETGSTGFAE